METDKKRKRRFALFGGLLFVAIVLFLIEMGFTSSTSITYKSGEIKGVSKVMEPPVVPIAPAVPIIPRLDKDLYDSKIKELANNPPPVTPKPTIKKVKDPKTGKITTVSVPAPTVVPKPNLWPVATVYPNGGAILPFKRVIAYYGNLYSKKMGVLGEYSEAEMLAKLNVEVKKWETADPTTPVQPALHYIAVTAQESGGSDGKYRLVMPDKEIDKVLAIAQKINAIVFLDLQVGQSNLRAEVPLFEKYLKMPNVHLGIDPEFSMKTGKRPGTIIGTFSADDVNYVVGYLSKLVTDNKFTPKILIVHRFTQNMITDYKDIKPTPEVQIVMNMDGWGGKAKKINTYKQFIYKEPVQFTGFKLFYKNDILEPGTTLFTPAELLKLNPRPIYIQYQ
jgi:hypothetical protein